METRVETDPIMLGPWYLHLDRELILAVEGVCNSYSTRHLIHTRIGARFSRMPATRARISTCRELSAYASHSNVIGTSRGSIFTAVTSIVWLVATRLSCLTTNRQ